MSEPKKKMKRKRKTRAKSGQVITQKVTVNIGGYGTKRRTGTQAKRSVQPQVIYQQQPIPLQPDYSSQLNDLRNEVRTHLSGVDKEDGRRRAIELREQYNAQMVQDELARRIAVQEGIQGTAPQTQREAPAVAPDKSFVTSLEEAPNARPNPLEPKRGRSSTERQANPPKAQAPPKAPPKAPEEKKIINIPPKKKRGRPPGARNKAKAPAPAPGPAPGPPQAAGVSPGPAPGPPQAVGVQVAQLAGVVGTPVSELAAAEKERLAAEAEIRSRSGGAAAAEGQTSMTDYVFR